LKLDFILPPRQRLDTGITLHFPEKFSRTLVQSLIKNGNVFIQGKICIKPSFKAENPVNVSIDYEAPVEYILQGNDQFSVPVIFQDEHLAIIHKPRDMTVHPGAGTRDDTLVHVLLSQIKTLSEGSDRLRPGIVHRLDRETEGLMIIAKNNQTHFMMAEAFAERKITKEYHAWVWGLCEPMKEISGYIGRHPRDRKKMLFEFFPLEESYKTAILTYTKINSSEYFSLLKINLHTGRTHQIRATFAKLNLPVVGDTLYSHFSRKLEKTNFSAEQKKIIADGGLYLMASRLNFIHPVTGKNLDFQLPLPERFQKLEFL